MAHLDNRYVWQLMNDVQFDIDTDLYSDLICKCCKNVAVNPYLCSCGSRYCAVCVGGETVEDMKRCPKEHCDNDHGVVEHELKVDSETSRRISSINVKCKEKHCQFIGQLQSMPDHVQGHQVQCPYENIGCMKPRIRLDTMGNHLHNKNYEHTTLLMNFIYNLRNEVSALQEQMRLDRESAQIREIQIHASRKESEELKAATIGFTEEVRALKEFCIKFQIPNESSNKELGKPKKPFLKSSFKPIHRKSEKSKEKHNSKNEMKVFLDENAVTNPDGLNMPSKERSLGFIEEKIQYSKKVQLYKSVPKSSKMKIPQKDQILTPFYWICDAFKKHEDFNKTAYNTIYSEPFYTHNDGYKMCLRVDPGRFSFGFSVRFHILKGDFDDRLSWPMGYEVTICLADQTSGKSRFTRNYQYNTVENIDKIAFEKPTNNINAGCGTKFIPLSNFSNSSKIVVNDSILLKCSVTVI